VRLRLPGEKQQQMYERRLQNQFSEMAALAGRLAVDEPLSSKPAMIADKTAGKVL
jgi:hypothetical protein